MSSFHERQKCLFDQLKDAEEQCSFSKTNKAPREQDYGAIDKYTYRKLKHEMKQFRGRESIYKRHDANIRECLRAKTIPDHIKNPQKYDYYSLADVTPEQMSDSTNTSTALSFIREMEDREAANSNMECERDETGLFKKPTFQVSRTVKREPKPDEKVVFKSNKIVMPEYVVGVTKKKEKKIKIVKNESDNTETKKIGLKLNHLYDDAEDD